MPARNKYLLGFTLPCWELGKYQWWEKRNRGEDFSKRRILFSLFCLAGFSLKVDIYLPIEITASSQHLQLPFLSPTAAFLQGTKCSLTCPVLTAEILLEYTVTPSLPPNPGFLKNTRNSWGKVQCCFPAFCADNTPLDWWLCAYFSFGVYIFHNQHEGWALCFFWH